MELIEVSKLKPFPKNDYFFDDLTGPQWEEFKKSIKSSGVIEPVIVTTDLVIISGHQRVRACKELGIDSFYSHAHTGVILEGGNNKVGMQSFYSHAHTGVIPE